MTSGLLVPQTVTGAWMTLYSQRSILSLLVFWRSRRVGPEPLGAAQGIAQHVLDLGVERAQFVIGPVLHRRQNPGIDAQWVGFLFVHDSCGVGALQEAGMPDGQSAPATCPTALNTAIRR